MTTTGKQGTKDISQLRADVREEMKLHARRGDELLRVARALGMKPTRRPGKRRQKK